MPDSTLVIGGSGFLGRNLISLLTARGEPPLAIYRADGDLRDRSACERIFKALPKVATIFHLATFQRTGEIQYRMQSELLDNNAQLHLNVLACWAKYQPQAKLVSAGSSCSYPDLDSPIGEDRFQTGPLHDSVRSYGLMKQLLAIGSGAYASQYGLNYLHGILATVYGPHDHLEPERSHFIGGMMARALKERAAGAPRFTVWGSPDTARECLYVSDQLEALLAASAGFSNCILNCAANAQITIGEMASAVLQVLKWEVPIEFSTGAFRGASRKVLDSSRFLTGTAWRPRVSLHAGLAELRDDISARLKYGECP